MAQQYDPMAEMWSGDVFGKLAAHPDTRQHLGDQSFISTIEGIITDPSSVKLFMQVCCWVPLARAGSYIVESSQCCSHTPVWCHSCPPLRSV